jgi:2-methylcitrate dehydratase PrpD
MHAAKRSDASNATEFLAALASSLRIKYVPRDVIERTKDLILDHIGVTLFGAHKPWITPVRKLLLKEGGTAEATIYGSARVPSRSAAFANGAAAHAVEFDDTHDESLQHPGCVVIPAAMAIGEELNRSGAELIAAVVAGYDVQCRIGAALGRPINLRGYHPTATCGVFGAAAAAANLMRLRTDGTVGAFGTAASLSAGLMQFSEDPLRADIKRLYSGLPAERGLLAAKLARAGFPGPKGAIEGKFGLANVLAGKADFDRMTARSRAFEIERITVKIYPCCKQFHSMIEAIKECRHRRLFKAGDVAALEPVCTRAMIDTHMEYRPRSTMAAQYSLPYVTAAAIALDARKSESFEKPNIHRKSVLALADLVKPKFDEKLEAMFPRRFPGGIRIKLKNGEQLTATVLDSLSSPEKPITRQDIQSKFRSVTVSILTRSRQQEIIDTVVALDRGHSVRDLAKLLRGR